MPGDYRSGRAALFDGIEEGGIRSSSYTSHEIDEHDNDRAVDGLQDRVNILKRIHVRINKLSIAGLHKGLTMGVGGGVAISRRLLPMVCMDDLLGLYAGYTNPKQSA
ncbi:Bet1-like SNARE 1-1 [Platanthera zijinensis]|uniref:Bet1-like SNARE 1-1 n=1 Tax=Platanthera zijinensis TaxID=2320716 RepID=A0AAP0BTI1_9ASPA